MSNLEQLVERSALQSEHRADSPIRAASPTTSDELNVSEDHNVGLDSQTTLLESSQKGPQTGVKGVRADAARQAQSDRQRRDDAVQATNRRMESMALGRDRTWEADDKQRREEAAAGVKTGELISKAYDADDADELQAIRMRRLQSIKSQAAAQESRRKRLAGENEGSSEAKSKQSSGHFGHLREVGHDQYVQAIENENEATFVVVHIYVKHVHACAMLTSALSSIARMQPSAKFIQIRAGCIGFGSGGLHDIDKEDVDEDTLDEKAEDVVPTLLIYRKSEMLANLVRVDLDPRWGDGSERCIQDILNGYGVSS